MARTPAPEVNITEALQPAATVHDTYWRPAQPEPSPLHDVARALSSLSDDLSQAFGKMDAANAVNAKEQGETAFWTGQSPGNTNLPGAEGVPAPSADAVAHGYRTGTLPLFGSKAAKLYEDGYQSAAGYAAGMPMQGRIMEAYTALPEDQKMAMTPQEFDAWVLTQIRNDPSAASANSNPAYARGIQSQYREIFSKVSDQWRADRTKDAQIKANAAWGSALTTTLEQSSVEGKSREGGTDYAQATANVQAIREAGFKAGLRQDEIDKQVAAAVIERATLDRDPTMLTILDNLKEAGGKPLSSLPNIQAARNTATSQIGNLREQDRQRAQAESDRQDKLAHDGSLRRITDGLMRDNNFTPDPKDVANVYRRDPQAEATILKLRQTIADGKGFEDPEKIARLQKDIFDGGGWDALRRGMPDIHTAATLKAMRDAVINHETYIQGDTKLFEGQSWKRLENLITDAGKSPDIGGSAFREPALTDASLAALNDARIAGLQWAQAHPGATGIEKEQFISDLTAKFLPAIQKDATGRPVYTQSDAIRAAREGGGQPAATQAAPAPQNAPAAPAGPANGPQNPMLPQGQNSTAKPPAIKPWIQDLANSPDAPPRYEDMKGLGAEYRKDIEDMARKLGKDPQWVIDKTWQKLKANIDAARGAASPQQGPAKAAPAVPQAPVPNTGPRSEITVPGLGSIDLASIDQNQLRTIAGQIMQRVNLSPEGLKVPGFGTIHYTPEGQGAFPVQRASLTTTQGSDNLAMAATQEGIDLGGRIREAMVPDNSGVTAQNGGPIVGTGLQQVSQRRVAQVNALPSGAIIDRVAKAQGFDPDVAKAIASIESSGRPNVSTGSYHGLFQLSQAEFQKFGPNDGRTIMDPEANTIAGINSIKHKMAVFKKDFGREPSPTELYLMHQQGEGGLRAHAAHPERLAWESMHSTAEGRNKGENWSKMAVWGNVPSDMKPMFGSVDNITSGQFIAVWINKLQGVPYNQALALVQQKGAPKVASSEQGKDI